MKRLQLPLMAILLLSIATAFSPSKKSQQTPVDQSTARVTVYSGKQVFFWNEPTTEYEVAFTFQNVIANINCLNPQQVANATITNANQESGSQNKLYDAVIIGNGTERDIAIVWKDKTKDNAIARVKRNQGYYVFVDCEPIAGYDIAGRYDVGGKGCKATMQQKVDQLIAKGTKKHKGKFDGVIYASSKLDMVIKFKAP